ncbi:hypothetical protein NYR52_13200 [Laceyella sacchari]|uniref:Uncharacterized protein n=1 Tax=Laceyella sacchari TaxID=37482 RepID=A0ABY5U0Q3_LACSH|nr:hypothetical protein [Laceyella sacchari]UWE03068.1 hypothetical protein NYR52_13200 [Laceyella sacchari]
MKIRARADGPGLPKRNAGCTSRKASNVDSLLHWIHRRFACGLGGNGWGASDDTATHLAVWLFTDDGSGDGLDISSSDQSGGEISAFPPEDSRLEHCWRLAKGSVPGGLLVGLTSLGSGTQFMAILLSSKSLAAAKLVEPMWFMPFFSP